MTDTVWNTDNPTKPWAPLDPDAIREVPWNWEAWLAAIGEDYSSHTLTPEAPLEVVSSRIVGGKVIAKLKFGTTPAAPAIGQKYACTCHIVTTPNGQEDDMTLYFKCMEK